MDSRIGPKFLKTSVGFGGSCFQKDILNLVYISKSLGLNKVAEYWNQIIEYNNHQRERFAKNILRSLYNTVAGKKICVFGWSFKKDTNDTRESAAIYVTDLLLEEMAKVNVYDPKVSEQQIFADINYLQSRSENQNRELLFVKKNPYDSCKGSHAVAILTEWDEFANYNWKKIYDSMKKPAFIFDGRNILDKNKIEKIGFIYKGIGKSQ